MMLWKFLDEWFYFASFFANNFWDVIVGKIVSFFTFAHRIRILDSENSNEIRESFALNIFNESLQVR